MLKKSQKPIASYVVAVVAILTVAGLEGFALHLGHNGQLFATAIGVIGLIAGAKLGNILRR